MKRTLTLVAILCMLTVVIGVAADGYMLRAVASVTIMISGILAGFVAGIEAAQAPDYDRIASDIAARLQERIDALLQQPLPLDARHEVLEAVVTKIAELQRQVNTLLNIVARGEVQHGA